MPGKAKPHRVQMDLSPKSYERLKEMMVISEAESYSDLLKDALQLLEYILKLDASGAKFIVEHATGDRETVKIFR